MVHLILYIHNDFAESNLDGIHSARPQSPMIMEELMIKFIENPENNFRGLLKRIYTRNVDFRSKTRTP